VSLSVELYSNNVFRLSYLKITLKRHYAFAHKIIYEYCSEADLVIIKKLSLYFE
jgi:hypothetical protein